MAPQNSLAWLHGKSAISPITRSMPLALALVLHTSIDCGNKFFDTKNFFLLLLWTEKDNAIASAAALLSSSNDAFAKSRPVNSTIIV